MGPSFVFVLWFIFATVYGAFWFGFLVVFVVGWRRRSRFLKWLAGVPLVGLTLLALLVGGLIAFVLIRESIPSYVYRDTFGEKPTADVIDLQSSTHILATDHGYTYLRFRASEETFRRICPRKLPRVPYQEYHDELLGTLMEQPVWWKPPTESTTYIYMLRTEPGKGERFSSEDTVMTYDAGTGVVQYYFMGID